MNGRSDECAVRLTIEDVLAHLQHYQVKRMLDITHRWVLRTECVLVSATLTPCMFRWVRLSLSVLVKLKNWGMVVSLNCCWCTAVFFMCFCFLNVFRIFSAQVEKKKVREWVQYFWSYGLLKTVGALPLHRLQTPGAAAAQNTWRCGSTEHLALEEFVHKYVSNKLHLKSQTRKTEDATGQKFQWYLPHRRR